MKTDREIVMFTVFYTTMICVTGRVLHRYLGWDPLEAAIVSLFWPLVMMFGMAAALLVGFLKLIIFFM